MRNDVGVALAAVAVVDDAVDAVLSATCPAVGVALAVAVVDAVLSATCPARNDVGHNIDLVLVVHAVSSFGAIFSA